jgi:lysozyme
MNLRDRMVDLLSLHEGRVAHAYKDSLGYLTIGVGHLIDQRKGGRLPEYIIDALLEHDIREHSAPLYEALPWISSLDEVRQAVILDMGFNLGVGGLLKWKNTLADVEAGNYESAAKRMAASLWARQVKTRATRLVEMMKTGQWPTDVKWRNQ